MINTLYEVVETSHFLKIGTWPQENQRKNLTKEIKKIINSSNFESLNIIFNINSPDKSKDNYYFPPKSSLVILFFSMPNNFFNSFSSNHKNIFSILKKGDDEDSLKNISSSQIEQVIELFNFFTIQSEDLIHLSSPIDNENNQKLTNISELFSEENIDVNTITLYKFLSFFKNDYYTFLNPDLIQTHYILSNEQRDAYKTKSNIIEKLLIYFEIRNENILEANEYEKEFLENKICSLSDYINNEFYFCSIQLDIINSIKILENNTKKNSLSEIFSTLEKIYVYSLYSINYFLNPTQCMSQLQLDAYWSSPSRKKMFDIFQLIHKNSRNTLDQIRSLIYSEKILAENEIKNLLPLTQLPTSYITDIQENINLINLHMDQELIKLFIPPTLNR